jgi:hypothetical protein
MWEGVTIYLRRPRKFLDAFASFLYAKYHAQFFDLQSFRDARDSLESSMLLNLLGRLNISHIQIR